MPGRTLLREDDLVYSSWLSHPDLVRRRAILRETLRAFENADPPDKYHLLAMQNLQRWRNESLENISDTRVLVLPGDWGDVTLSLTKEYGTCFAVLNMANAYVPGGAYVEGTAAQEENMFRRTDCHFHIGPQEYDSVSDRYLPEMTELISGQNGIVYLDMNHKRVCIRGSEDRSRSDLGYPWLADDRIFPFYELRAAARDLRDGSPFDPEETRRGISAQFNTLRQHNVKHAVLGAFGCGAFQNPSNQVARIYKGEIARYRKDFRVIAFAVFHAGYGPDNYEPFKEVFLDE